VQVAFGSEDGERTAENPDNSVQKQITLSKKIPTNLLFNNLPGTNNLLGTPNVKRQKQKDFSDDW